jgi:apolipoprotein N-acyltransferase
MTNRQKILNILLAAVCMTAAYPPSPFGPLAFVGWVPFFMAIRGLTPKSALAVGFPTGFLVSLGTLYWIAWPTVPGCIGALLVMSCYFALFAFLLAWLGVNWGDNAFVLAPFVWTGIETLSSWGPLAFPWNSLAYTLTHTPMLIQFASITGAQGVSFWIVSVNVLVFFLVQTSGRRKRILLFLLVLALVLPFLYGAAVFSRSQKSASRNGTVRVAMIQGNIDPYKKWTPSFIDSNFIIYDRMTRNAALQKPDLVVWPETATACYLRHRFVYLNWIKYLADNLNTSILTGSLDYIRLDSSKTKNYNAAFLLHPGSWQIDSYYKMRLVPFSERVPFVEVIPFLEKWALKVSGDIGDYSSGDSISVFQFVSSRSGERHRFSVHICFESVFPYLVCKFVRRGAEFLVVITNDGWFGDTSGPRQHAQIAVLRAIENRRWVARCANTGVSEFIDPYGRITDKAGWNHEAILIREIQPLTELTLFVRYPWFFSGMVLLVNGVVFAWTILRQPAFRKLRSRLKR